MSATVNNPNATRRGHYFARAIEREATNSCRTGGCVADGLRRDYRSPPSHPLDAPDYIAAGSVGFQLSQYVPLMTAIERGAA